MRRYSPPLYLRYFDISIIRGLHLLECWDILLDIILHTHGTQVSQLIVLADTGRFGYGDIAQFAVLVYWFLLEVAIAAIVCHGAAEWQGCRPDALPAVTDPGNKAFSI